MKNYIITLTAIFALIGCKQNQTDTDSNIETSMRSPDTTTEIVGPDPDITPISHATMILDWDGTIIYVDPVGGEKAFEARPPANIILITDIHGDHLNLETVQAVADDSIPIIGPEAVGDELRSVGNLKVIDLYNGDTMEQDGFKIEAIPMYNLREEAKKFHHKGRGNGYVIEKGGKRVYISGDTEDIPEMRNLKDIDIAFVCMNLPYTMTVESAADVVLDFKPKVVYPYHYRGTDGLSDVEKFAQLVGKGNSDITVKQLDWYPTK